MKTIKNIGPCVAEAGSLWTQLWDTRHTSAPASAPEALSSPSGWSGSSLHRDAVEYELQYFRGFAAENYILKLYF